MSTRTLNPSRRRSRRALLAAASVPLMVCAGWVQALPTGGVVTGTSGGSVVISGFGSSLSVTSAAHRAIIDWTTFGVASGQTVNFNVPDKDAIVVNRQMTSGASEIDGAINSSFPGATPSQPRITGGNIWIINPNGVVFGPNAVVNVGGLLATTANLTSDKAFLSAADTDPISFTGGPAGSAVTIDSGAQITVYDGAALFIADMVSANGAVQGAGIYSTGTQVLYGGARAFTIQFSQAAPDPLRATDLGLFDFTVDQGGSSLAYGGNTNAGQIILDMVSANPAVSGDATLTVSGGVLTATGDRGDGNDLLIVADNIAGGAPAGDPYASGTTTMVGQSSSSGPAPQLISAGGLVLSGDDVDVGTAFEASAQFNIAGESQVFGNHVYLENVGGLITPNVSTGPSLDDPYGVQTSVLVVDQYHSSTLGTVGTLGTIDIESLDGATTGALGGASGVTVLTGGPTVLGDVTAANGAVTLTSSDSVTAASISGRSVTASTGGAVTFTQFEGGAPGTADANFEVSGATNATAGAVNMTATGQVVLGGAVTAAGVVNITAGDDMTVVAITAGGAETLLGGANITTGLLTTPSTVDVEATKTVSLGGAAAGSLLARAGLFTDGQPGAAQTLTVVDAVNVQTGAVFQATGLFNNEAPITVLAANTPAKGSGVPLTTVLEVDSTAATIGAPISISDASGGTAAIVLNSLNPNGVAVGDGLTGTSGLYSLSAAGVSMLSADGVLVLASDTANLTVGNLSIDAARTPLFQLGVGSGVPEGESSTITVAGVVTGTGAPTFEVGGSAIGVGGGDAAVSYTPDRVIVSGAVGTSSSPFGEVDLVADSDVLIGSAAFVQAFDAASDPTALPSDVYTPGFGGVATGYTFIDAGVVQLGATRAIAQQNTGPLGGGLMITTTLAINDEPVRVDLFGYVPNAANVLVNGPPAALSPNILINGTPPATHSYLFNGCRIGDPTDCQAPTVPTTPINSNTRPPTPQDFPPVQTLSIYPWDTGDLIVLPSAQRQAVDPTKKANEPASGVANEDVWPTTESGVCPPDTDQISRPRDPKSDCLRDDRPGSSDRRGL